MFCDAQKVAKLWVSFHSWRRGAAFVRARKQPKEFNQTNSTKRRNHFWVVIYLRNLNVHTWIWLLYIYPHPFHTECDISSRDFSVSRLFSIFWEYRSRSWKYLVSKKSLGIGLKNIWSRKKVSVSVSKTLVSKKVSVSVSKILVSKKVSVTT